MRTLAQPIVRYNLEAHHEGCPKNAADPGTLVDRGKAVQFPYSFGSDLVKEPNSAPNQIGFLSGPELIP